MLGFVRDLPNLCSLAGLLAALLGLYFTIRGVYPAALTALLWAIVFDRERRPHRAARSRRHVDL